MSIKEKQEKLFNEGKELLFNRSIEKAIKCFEESEKLISNPLTLFYMGRGYIVLKKYEEAYLAFCKAYDSLPFDQETDEHTKVLRMLAEVNINLGKFAEAEENIKRARDIGSRVFDRATCRNLEEKHRKLISQVKNKRNEIKYSKIEDMFRKGNEFEEKKEYFKAIEMFTKYNENIEKIEGHQALARCYRATRNFEKALQHIEIINSMCKIGHLLHQKAILSSIGLKADILLDQGRMEEAYIILKEECAKSYSNSKSFLKLKRKLSIVTLQYDIHQNVLGKSPKEEWRPLSKIQDERKFAGSVLENLKEYEQKNEKYWYLVSTKWYSAWEKYMQMIFEEKKKELDKEFQPDLSQYPGPIFNEEIILFEESILDPCPSNRYLRYPLKDGLKESIDFIIIPGIL